MNHYRCSPTAILLLGTVSTIESGGRSWGVPDPEEWREDLSDPEDSESERDQEIPDVAR